MRVCRRILLATLIASTFLVACATHAQTRAAASDDTVLVHRFVVPQQQAWGTITVELTACSHPTLRCAPRSFRACHQGFE